MPKKRDEIEELFISVDTDGDGVISFNEALVVLREDLGYNLEQSSTLWNSCDSDGDGTLSFSEFIDFYFKVQKKFDELEAVFAKIDKNKDGVITVNEAKQGLKVMGFSDKEMDDLIKKNDDNMDGKLDFGEFVKLWNST